jgi:hypothetical protein
MACGIKQINGRERGRGLSQRRAARAGVNG